MAIPHVHGQRDGNTSNKVFGCIPQYTILMSIAIFGLLQMLSVILFWYFHLRHHQKHPVYRIRHPKFWILCIAVSSFQTTWKAMVTYCRLHYIINEDIYQLLNQCGVLLIGYGFVIGRGIVLCVTVKLQQYEENILFQMVLVSQKKGKTDTKLINDKPFLYQYKKHLSNPFHVFFILQSLYLILNVIGALLTFIINRRVSKFFIISIVMVFWAMLSCAVYIIWRSGYNIKYQINDRDIQVNTKFVDHFNFRWEITIIWIDVLIFVPLRSYFAVKYKIEINNDYAHNGLVLLAFLTLLSQLFPVLTQIIIPYWTFRRNKISSNNINDITVFDVLSDKHSFLLFINHAVQELNLENISLLIAIYQFKCSEIAEDKLNPEDICFIDIETNDIDDIIDIELRRKSVSVVVSDIKFCAEKLQNLPWDDIPLIESMSNVKETRYTKAKKIYNKYFSTSSIYTVNISGGAKDCVSDTFLKLQQYRHNQQNGTYDGGIKSYEGYQECLLKVFDSVLPDLCDNLECMMSRFKSTKEFKSLSIL